MIKAGLKCSFMAHNTIKKNLRQIEKIKDWRSLLLADLYCILFVL